ncbi:hypothetical protein [Prochlorococcus marinus]|uniref:Glycosyltransferase n=1 Tax=Prochlorococcus marinus (strain MIT 9303) TaxID=59922 RepID=A2CBB3_PROM3|nr:hypothetical protein [Prochlorococcus marinus]ABM78773.1 Hypothetical protein P9303_20311 [Prochlorococcus marinus str. MIT 9303]
MKLSKKNEINKNLFNICQIKPHKYIHANALDPLMNLVYYTMTEAGYDCSRAINQIASSRVNIIIGAHLLNIKAIAKLPKKTILLNTEQLNNCPKEWREIIISCANNEFKVWDYSKRNLNIIKNYTNTLNCSHFPIGYNRFIDLNLYCTNSQKDIDVLFYGSLNNRRERILKGIESLGANVVAVFGIYGKQLDELISRAKFVINIHYYDSKILESIRLFYLLSNRIPTISEFSYEAEDDNDIATLVNGFEYERLIEETDSLLSQDYTKICTFTASSYKKFVKRSQLDLMQDLFKEI